MGERGAAARGCGGSILRRRHLQLMHCGGGGNQRARQLDEVKFLHRGGILFVCWDTDKTHTQASVIVFEHINTHTHTDAIWLCNGERAVTGE